MKPSDRTSRRRVAIVVLGVALLAGGLLAETMRLAGGGRPLLLEIFDASPPEIFVLSAGLPPPSGDQADLHIEATALDDVKHLLTLRVSGYRACAPTCAAAELVLAALREDESTARGLPPLVTVPLPAEAGPVLATVELPVYGRVIRYPFDTYELLLGVALRRAGAEAAAQSLPAAEAASRLRLTLQEAVPQMAVSAPSVLDPPSFHSPTVLLDYVYVARLTFDRMMAVKLMTVVLLTLIAGTALYTVFLRSLHDLVLGFGGFILGVWSVRAILVPGGLSQRTGVDVALITMIALLLVALGIRALRIWWRPPVEE
jgi:hypothetical protein